MDFVSEFLFATGLTQPLWMWLGIPGIVALLLIRDPADRDLRHPRRRRGRFSRGRARRKPEPARSVC